RIARPDQVGDTRLAPIQGLLLRNGAWTATGPNLICASNGTVPLMGLTATTRVLERGPLEAKIQVTYTYQRPDFIYANVFLIPGGPGSYTSTITLQAGQPSILVED